MLYCAGRGQVAGGVKFLRACLAALKCYKSFSIEFSFFF